MFEKKKIRIFLNQRSRKLRGAFRFITIILALTLMVSLISIFEGCATPRGAARRAARRTVRRMEKRENVRSAKPGPNYWWNGREWRKLPPAPKNTVWVEGHYEGNVWAPGHFKYVGPAPQGKVWVQGHWEGNTWVRGHFRPAVRSGFVWVPGHYDRKGRWVKGYWKPAR